MHNDEPTLRDRLRREDLIKEVGEAIATCEPPQVFGVHGDWGLGKTSFLQQVRYHLTGDNPQTLDTRNAPVRRKSEFPVQAVWFDAWRYHAEEVPVVALLQEMRAQLSAEARQASAVKRLGEVAVNGILLGLDDVTKKIGIQYAKFQQASRQWSAENLAATLPSDSLRENLQETIRLLLPETDGEAARLVVFVDDLDRCEPEAAYRLLEGLKVYLTLNNCVFVLGLNQRGVEGAIATRLAAGQTDATAIQDAKGRATSYLEKICQNIWHLPIVHAPGRLLCELIEADGGIGEAPLRWLRDVVQNRPCLPPNPRKLKGLANLVIRLCSRLPADLDDNQSARGHDEMRKILLVAYVHQFHHDLYVRWQANLHVYEAVRRWCRNEGPDNMLRALVLPTEADDPDTAGVEFEIGGEEGRSSAFEGRDQSAFPDPTATNVFWVASVVRDLPDQAGLETFAPYLGTKSTSK